DYLPLSLHDALPILGNPPFATRESLPDIREKELENAVEAIGITDLRKMGLRDKTVEFEPHDEMDEMIKSLIDELNPSVIISFYRSEEHTSELQSRFD